MANAFDGAVDGAFGAAVGEPDQAAADATRRRQAALGRPPGSLGRLEELAGWAAAVQGRCPPHPFQRVRVILFAGDHGIATAGVSAYPPGATEQMVQAVLAGGAAVNVLARAAGAGVRLVDVAMDSPTGSPDRVRRGSGRIDREDALSPAEARRAFDTGARVADEEVDAGADLLVPGELGVGSTTPAATLVAALTGAEPVEVVGRGSGIDDDAWMRKAAAIRDALRRVRGQVDPMVLLQIAGGADLAALAGLLSQAARRRTPVLLDSLVPTAAALLAREVTPAAVPWWLAASRSGEPAHDLAMSRLGLDPVLDLGLRLGQGTAALIVLPLLDAAIRLLGEPPISPTG